MTTLLTRPATAPLWNSGAANRTTPTGPKQVLGWVMGEGLTSAFLNWWMNLSDQWQNWATDSIDKINAGKLEKSGDTFAGSYLPDNDGTRDLGSTSKRLRAVYTASLESMSLQPPDGGGGNIGGPSRYWEDIFVQQLKAYFVSIDPGGQIFTPSATVTGTLTATTISAGGVSANAYQGNSLNVITASATGRMTAPEFVTGEFGHGFKGGIRQLDTNRATLVIDKPANVAFSQAFHVSQASNIGVVTAAATVLTVAITAMADATYGIEFSGCRGLGVGGTDLLMAQFYNKTTTGFQCIFYYWTGATWASLTLDTVNALAAIRATIRIVGNDG